MSYTSRSEFDINRRVHITNEIPVYNLFEALNSALQSDFYEWILGNEEVRYNVPYSIKQENPNGEFIDNSVAGIVGRFNIVRDEQESDGATQLERLDKNQLYFKSVNGKVSSVYGPKPSSKIDGPNTFYHSKKLSGVILPEYDLLLHHFYRYLEVLYPDNPDWSYLLTPNEINDSFRAAGKMIDYEPDNLFFNKVAKSLSDKLTSDEVIDESMMIKIHNLKDEAYRRKFYGAYAGYKMLGNDIFQHISVFPVATYLPVKPKENSFSTGTEEEKIENFNNKYGTSFKTIDECIYYEKTNLRIIDTFAETYSNKFKLIDYNPKTYGTFSGYKSFKFFSTLWSNSIYEYGNNFATNANLISDNISLTSVLKDSFDINYPIESYGDSNVLRVNVDEENDLYEHVVESREEADGYIQNEKYYYVNLNGAFSKSKIPFEVYDFPTSQKCAEIYSFLGKSITESENNIKVILNNSTKENKDTYICPVEKNALYLDIESTLNCYRNDKLYKDISYNKDSVYKIYKTVDNKFVNAILLYSFTPGFISFENKFSIDTTQKDEIEHYNYFAITLKNIYNEEILFFVKGQFNINMVSASGYYSVSTENNLRILSIPETIKESFLPAFSENSVSIGDNNSSKIFSAQNNKDILINNDCKVVKICKVEFESNSSGPANFENITLKEIESANIEKLSLNNFNLGWGNFRSIFEKNLFTVKEGDFEIRTETTTNGITYYPFTKEIFFDSETNEEFFKKYLSLKEKDINLYYECFGDSEFNDSVKNYILDSLENIRLYSTEAQDKLTIEGSVDLTIANGENLINFDSEIEKEKLKSLSIGDLVEGNCVDNDDGSVFITEIGENYIRVNNSLIASGTFDFVFYPKILTYKIEKDNPIEYIDRLKAKNYYEFYNPFQHGIGTSVDRCASKAYVNGISNINSWTPFVANISKTKDKYKDFIRQLYKTNDDTKQPLPSTIKFMNDLFVEYNADKILNYPTRSGKENCLMSVDWLDYLENRVNEASRLSDKTNVGVCVSLQTDKSKKSNYDKNINSYFHVLDGFLKQYTNEEGFNIPRYARIGSGKKEFKDFYETFDLSSIGKSVYGKSVYSEKNEETELPEGYFNGNDYYGGVESAQIESNTYETTYNDIDNSLFEISIGENDVIQNFNYDNKDYTLIQVNICKQTFKNLLKYSEGDEKWLRILNVNEENRSIFNDLNLDNLDDSLKNKIKNEDIISSYNNLNYSGNWSPSITNYELNYPKGITENLSYWLIETGGEFLIKDENSEELINKKINDYSVLIAKTGKKEIKNFKFCNAFINDNSRHYTDIEERNYGKPFHIKDTFIQFILISLGIFSSDEVIRKSKWIAGDENEEAIVNSLLEKNKITLAYFLDYENEKFNTYLEDFDFGDFTPDLTQKYKFFWINRQSELAQFPAYNDEAISGIFSDEEINENWVTGIYNSQDEEKYLKFLAFNSDNYATITCLNTIIKYHDTLVFNNDDSFKNKCKEKVISPISNINTGLMNKLEETVFLFPVQYFKYESIFSKIFEEEDIICFFKFENDFYCLNLNKSDLFVSNIEVSRIGYGVSDNEWKIIKDENYNTLSISKTLNSTFDLPRKFLNDDYDFDIIINPQYIGTGYPYNADNETIDYTKEEEIEISKGAIYYDDKNDEFYIWTNKKEDNGQKKFAIKFEENKYFKNTLTSYSSYRICDTINKNNQTLKTAIMSEVSELPSGFDKINAEDKILEVKEIKLRPITTSEPKFFSDEFKIKTEISGVDFSNKKLIAYAKNIEDKINLKSFTQKLLPARIDNNGKIQVVSEAIDENNNVNLNDNENYKRIDVINSKFTRPLVRVKDAAIDDSYSPNYKYFKNNLIFVGELDRKTPNKIILNNTDSNFVDLYTSALNNLQKGDTLNAARLVEKIEDGSFNRVSFTSGGNPLNRDCITFYNDIDKKFSAIRKSGNDIIFYTQNDNTSISNTINFTPKIIPAAANVQAITGNILKLGYFSDKYIFSVENGNFIDLYEITAEDKYKKFLGTTEASTDYSDYEILKLDNNPSEIDANFDYVRIEDFNCYNGTVTLEPKVNQIGESETETINVGKIDVEDELTSPWEVGDKNLFIKTSNSFVENILVSDKDLFIYSKLNKTDEYGNYYDDYTKYSYWHHFDLSNIINNSENYFKGLSLEEAINYTKKVIESAEKFIEDDALKGKVTTLKGIFEENTEGLIGDNNFKLSTFKIEPDEETYKFNSNCPTDDEPVSSKKILIAICELLGAPDCIKTISNSEIVDAFVKGNYLFLKNADNNIVYISLDNLIKYEDYSNIENWKTPNLNEYYYEKIIESDLERTFDSESINVPKFVNCSIFDIKDIEVNNNNIYYGGNILSKSEIDDIYNGSLNSLLEDAETITARINALKEKCPAANGIYPLIIKDDTQIKLPKGDDIASNYFDDKSIRSIKVIKGEVYFYIYNNSNIYSVIKESQENTSELFTENSYERELGLKDFYDFGESAIYLDNIGYIESNYEAQELRFNSVRILSNENSVVTLNNNIMNAGVGIVKVLFSFTTKSNIEDVDEFVDNSHLDWYYGDLANNTFYNGFELTEVSTYEKANRVYSKNYKDYVNSIEGEFNNDEFFYPYFDSKDTNFAEYFNPVELKNNYGSSLKYCDERGAIIGTETVYAPKYSSVESLNKNAQWKEVQVDCNVQKISKFNATSNPFIIFDCASTENGFSDRLVGGDYSTAIYEITDYIKRKYDGIVNAIIPTEDEFEAGVEITINNDTYSLEEFGTETETELGDPILYLYNKDLDCFVIDVDFSLEATLKVPYLFNNDEGLNILSTDLEKVKATNCTGIFIPNNGYGSFEGNEFGWKYYKPWDIDPDAFKENKLKNSSNEYIYLCDEKGLKIESENGEDIFEKNKPIDEIISKDSLEENIIYKTINISKETGEDIEKGIQLTKVRDTKPVIYTPFLSNFNKFPKNLFIKVMKDGINILNNSTLSNLKFYLISEDDEVELTYTFDNSKIVTFDTEIDNNFVNGKVLKIVYKDSTYEIGPFNDVIQPNGTFYRSILDKNFVYKYENNSYDLISKDKTINFTEFDFDRDNLAIFDINNENGKSLKLNINSIDEQRISYSSYTFKLNISPIYEIKKFEAKTGYICYQFDDSIFAKDKILNLFDLSKLPDEAEDFESDYLNCNVITSSGIKVYHTSQQENIVISGLKSNIIMREPKYNNISTLISIEKNILSKHTKNIFSESDYDNNECVGVNQKKNKKLFLNNFIQSNQSDVENNLNDGKTHYIMAKFITSDSILFDDEMLKENNEDFIEIKSKDLIKWPPDRVYLNEKGILPPPVKVGLYLFNTENFRDYEKTQFKNNNNYPIYLCDDKGVLQTFELDEKNQKKQIPCTNLMKLFNPNTPKFELNKDYFKNNFYKEGEEVNPFWQIIKIKKDYDYTGDLKEIINIYEYKKESDKIVLKECEYPIFRIYKTSEFEQKDNDFILNKNINYINKKQGRIKFCSKLDNYEYYTKNENFIKYGIQVENTLAEKIKDEDFDSFTLPTYEKCNFTINTIGSNKINNDDSIIEITELGLFDKNNNMIAYATFPPIEYRSDSQHVSFLLYIYNGEYPENKSNT